MDEPPKPRDGKPRLGTPVLRARAALLWESVWRAVWPAVCIAGLFVALGLLDVLPRLPGWLHAGVLAVLAAGFLWSLWRAARSISLPTRLSAERRLESATGLKHRPLQVLSDRLAEGTPHAASAELWEMHKRRMADAVARLRAGVPAPAVARQDPVAVRAGVFILLLVGVAAGWSEPGPRLARALDPEVSLLPTVAEPNLEIWITPPEYTRLAPVFPKSAAADEHLAVPVGSKLTARVSGGSGPPSLVVGDDQRLAFEEVDKSNSQIETTITAGDRLAVEQNGKALGAWAMRVVPDTPPVIAFARPPFATKAPALGIAFTAADDYGIRTARVEMRRTYEGGDVIGKEVEELELPLPGMNVKDANETSFYDLAPHRWAGLPVAIRLKATDVAGQEASSEPANFVLPEREFDHPVARAIIEQRKRLTTEPEQRKSIYAELGEIAARPGAYEHDTVVFLTLIAARSRLRYERGEAAIPPVRDLLWETALRVEDGKLSLAERELRRLEQELMKALAEDASDEELERLMRELENAMQRYLQALAEELRNRPESEQEMPLDPRMQIIQSQDLQRMLDQIRELMRAGARDAARQMLAQLRNMMESLRSGRMARGNPMAQQSNEMMRQLQEMIQRQSELMNQTFRQSRTMSGPRPEQSMQGAQQQRQLQEMLRQFRQMLQRMQQGQQGQQGQEGQQGPGQALSQAEREMGRAAGALDQNAPGQAVGPMGEALNQLQQAGRGMMQQMMQQLSRDSGMGLQGQFNPLNQRRDPLGRFPPGDEGMDTRDVVVPDEGAIERAQRILDELRRRSGQHHRPRFELDYIDRLLRRF